MRSYLKSQSTEKVFREINGQLFKMDMVEPEKTQRALFSHFIYNNEDEVLGTYKKEAVKFIKTILAKDCPSEDITNNLAEKTLQCFIDNAQSIPFPAPRNPTFKFIDLFAGIGGFRLALQNLGGKCIFSSEWDKFAQQTYQANFGEIPFGDITKEETKQYIPDDFDILCAGFPCQAFSIAGKRGGFLDTRGTLFFDIAEIIKRKQPKAILLENVKGLVTHDKGNTLNVILGTLKELGYTVFTKIVNAKDFGVPQVRERIFIVGFNNNKIKNINEFGFPKPLEQEVFVNDFIESGLDGYGISKHLQEKYLFKKNDGNPQIIDRHTKIQVKTLVSTYHKIQRLTGTFVKDGDTGLRLLSINECKAIMGFPGDFTVPVSRTQAYKQFGNSVVVPVVQAIAKEMMEKLNGA